MQELYLLIFVILFLIFFFRIVCHPFLLLVPTPSSDARGACGTEAAGGGRKILRVKVKRKKKDAAPVQQPQPTDVDSMAPASMQQRRAVGQHGRCAHTLVHRQGGVGA